MRLFAMDRSRLKSLWIVYVFWFPLILSQFNIISPSYLQGQNRSKFEHLTIEDGLPQNTVYSILQDHKGFLWVGTEDGLCRYDGYSFKPYQYDPKDPASLSQNRVRCIYEDQEKILWIGTTGGLNKFDRVTERFTRYIQNPENPDGKLNNNIINSIYEDQDRVLWIGTHGGGLNKFNRENETFTHYFPPLPTANDYEHHKIRYIWGDGNKDNKELWIGTGNGLYTFDTQKETFKRYMIYPENSNKKCIDHVTCLYKDNSNILWIGMKDGGLIKFDSQTQHFTPFRYDPSVPVCGTRIQIRSIFEEKETGIFWIGTYGAGIYELNPQKEVYTNYKEHSGITTSLSNNYVFTIYKDRGGIIWIGTEYGLNKFNKRKNEFIHYAVEPFNKKSLSDNKVWSICKDKNGNVWIGTDKGLNRFERKTGTFTHYTNDPQKPDSLSHNRVTAICEDHQGVLWLGTQGGGLNRFDSKTGTFTNSIPPPGYIPLPGKSANLKHVSHPNIHVLLEDHQGALWIGTQDGGLNQMNRETETFTLYMPDQENPTTSLSHREVTSIFEDKTWTLWVGTGAGLNQLDRETGIFTNYKNHKDNPNSLSANHVSVIYEDQSGTLWVGTYYGGLNKLVNRKKRIFKHFRKKDGLPSDTINGILEDESGNLWLSTVNGLSKFDPVKKQFKNYFASDGLQNNEFNGGAWFKADDGEMFFGGLNGFNTFFPQRIIDNPNLPPVVITNFLVFNKPYLETSITEMKEIVLSHKDYVFSIEFSALDFSIPGKNQYEHKMNGVDPDWVQGNARKRFATYTNLSHGEYEFRVRATNNDGIWSDEEAVLKITITPPFTQTWLFRILLIVFIILSVLFAHGMRTNRLRKKLAEQKRIQEILKQSHDEMEKAKDLAELRHAENEKLLSAISSIFIAVDCHGFIFQWNKPAEKFFGIKPDDAIKKPLTKILKDCIDENKLKEIIEMGLKQDPSSKVIEFRVDLKHRGKGIRVLASGISPIQDSTCRTLGFLFLAEDITNRKEEEMLRILSKKLESMGQMASSIAHEIKTPLQYIGDNASFVSDSFKEVIQFYETINDMAVKIEKDGNKEISIKIKEFIEKYDMEFIMEELPKASEQINSGVIRVSDIIQSMNEFSHPGKGIIDKADINQLLKSTLVMVQSKIRKNADIHLELSDSLPLIPCYAGELNQVFMNILINAVDAIIDSKKWGVIKVSTTQVEKEIVITISDTGCGISVENQDHIFNPFFTTKEVGKGTGQGLSLAHNIITEKHQGRIDFSSQAGKGTTFYIRLPIKGEH